MSLRCHISGFPHPRVEFQRGGIEITPGTGMFENFVEEFYDQVHNTFLIWCLCLLI